MHPLARCLIAATFTFAVTLAPPASAQAWPAKPVRIVVNFPPGGPTDQIPRILAPQLGEALGQPVVIENRVGAGGTIGAGMVAKSAPDGYTLLHTAANPIVIGAHLYKLDFDPLKDLDPVSPTALIALLLVVRPGLPVRSLAELLAYARTNPGKLNFGSTGTGGAPHIAGEMLFRTAKIRAVHVPYKGATPALNALLGGEIDFAFDPGSAAPHIKADRVRLLAVASSTRSPSFPATPTMVEAGTDVDADSVQGFYAPAGTPREIIARLNREIGRILQTAAMRASLRLFGAEVAVASPEDFARRNARDNDRFGAIVREANIRAD